MQSELDPRHPLRRLFAGLVEQVFEAELGICAPPLTDYLAELLVDFLHSDDIYRLRDADGREIRELSRLRVAALAEAGAGDRDQERLLNRYVGDFALFWTGVYPEQLQARRSAGTDRLREYLLVGKESYGAASRLTGAGLQPAAELLALLSEQFESCAFGLHVVRATWEQQSRSGSHHN
jgi:hypothetical protein